MELAEQLREALLENARLEKYQDELEDEKQALFINVNNLKDKIDLLEEENERLSKKLNHILNTRIDEFKKFNCTPTQIQRLINDMGL